MNLTKPCLVCGRVIEWRKRWERCWDEVRYCSAKCRQNKTSSHDQKLETTILKLLSQRATKDTICPSEAARMVYPEDKWRSQMEAIRSAARRLVSQQKIEILQKGQVVNPSTAKGPIRLRLR